jgi:hypothetical protein
VQVFSRLLEGQEFGHGNTLRVTCRLPTALRKTFPAGAA